MFCACCVITALHSGLRKGEILSLKWDAVDLKHGFILLDRTKNGQRREIPINSTLLDHTGSDSVAHIIINPAIINMKLRGIGSRRMFEEFLHIIRPLGNTSHVRERLFPHCP